MKGKKQPLSELTQWGQHWSLRVSRTGDMWKVRRNRCQNSHNDLLVKQGAVQSERFILPSLSTHIQTVLLLLKQWNIIHCTGTEKCLPNKKQHSKQRDEYLTHNLVSRAKSIISKFHKNFHTWYPKHISVVSKHVKLLPEASVFFHERTSHFVFLFFILITAYPSIFYKVKP